MAKVTLTGIGDELRRAIPEDGSVPDDVRARVAAHRARVAAARLRVLAAILDLATTERDDSLTEIDIRTDDLAAPLRPTSAEWRAAEELATAFRTAYPDGLGDDVLGKRPAEIDNSGDAVLARFLRPRPAEGDPQVGFDDDARQPSDYLTDDQWRRR